MCPDVMRVVVIPPGVRPFKSPYIYKQKKQHGRVGEEVQGESGRTGIGQVPTVDEFNSSLQWQKVLMCDYY